MSNTLYHGDNLDILRKIKGRVCLLWMQDFGCRRPRTQEEMDRYRHYVSVNSLILKRLEDSFGSEASDAVVLDGVPRRGAHPSVGVERPRSSPPDRTQRSGVQRMKRFLGILLAAGGLLVASVHAHAQLAHVLPPAGTYVNQNGTWTFGSKLPNGDYPICINGITTNGTAIILETPTMNAWTIQGYWEISNGTS